MRLSIIQVRLEALEIFKIAEAPGVEVPDIARVNGVTEKLMVEMIPATLRQDRAGAT